METRLELLKKSGPITFLYGSWAIKQTIGTHMENGKLVEEVMYYMPEGSPNVLRTKEQIIEQLRQCIEWIETWDND